MILFLVTTFLLVLSPGPAAITVTTEAAAKGYRRAALVFLGVALGNVVWFTLSATGVATLMLASSTLFSALKWCGVGYLIYLGLGAILSRSGPLNVQPENATQGRSYMAFAKGFILEMTNPKALIYFSSLLPQFVDVDRPMIPQLTLLCFLTFCMDIISYSLYAYMGYKSISVGFKPWVVNVMNKAAGSMLIYAGFKMMMLSR